jgi:hypothetical protein
VTQLKKGLKVMDISKLIAIVAQYLFEAVVRIFGPTDDAYPLIGIQPFTGEPYNPSTADNW